VPAQLFGDLGFVVLTGCDSDEEPLVLVLGHRKLMPIHEQKGVR